LFNAFCLGQGLKGVRAAADQAMKAYYAGSMASTPGQPGFAGGRSPLGAAGSPPIPNFNYTGISGG